MVDSAWRWSLRHRLEPAFDQLREVLNREMTALAAPIAYHYTSTSSAKAIVETGNMWASDVSSMNDPTEWHHGHELMAAAVLRHANGRTWPSRSLAREVADNIRNRSRRLFHVMVTSCSGREDDLTMWHKYGEFGAGVCIGVDFVRCRDGQQAGGAAWSPVIYGNQAKANWVNSAVRAHFNCASRWMSVLVAEAMRVIVEQMDRSLQVQAGLLAMAMKEEAWANENERRLVQLVRPEAPSPHELRTRMRDGVAIPYVEIDVRHAVVDVTLGSSHAIDESTWRTLLNASGLAHVPVRRSGASSHALDG